MDNYQDVVGITVFHHATKASVVDFLDIQSLNLANNRKDRKNKSEQNGRGL